MRGYFGRVLIAIDQFINVLVFNGWPDETISSRLGREKKYGDKAGDLGCAVLDALQDNHCGMSIEETATGETDAHHLGRVIRELPRGQQAEPMRKIPLQPKES